MPIGPQFQMITSWMAGQEAWSWRFRRPWFPAAHLLPGSEELAAARRMPMARIQPANGDGW